jgi:hypothetical protein
MAYSYWMYKRKRVEIVSRYTHTFLIRFVDNSLPDASVSRESLLRIKVKDKEPQPQKKINNNNQTNLEL